MIAQSVDENIGKKVTDAIAAPGEWGKVILITIGLLCLCLVVLCIIIFFVRKKLPKDTSEKFIELP